MVSTKRTANSDEPKQEWALDVRELNPAEEKLMKELERSKFSVMYIILPKR
jgi:hypothetical protein